jgi:hypothetical protein
MDKKYFTMVLYLKPKEYVSHFIVYTIYTNFLIVYSIYTNFQCKIIIYLD